MNIDIKAQLHLLRELQDIDIVMREAEEELESIPKQIDEAKSGWLAANAELTQKEAEKASAEKERKNLETELEDNQGHLAERENKLYAIKTNKEYQAALKEISDGKRANKEREETVLKLMEVIEKLSAEITQLSGSVSDKETEFKKVEEVLRAKQVELEKEYRTRLAEVEKVRVKVDKKFLEKYDFIRARYLDPVANVEKGVCQGCYMNIPPQMFNELLDWTKLHFCPSCHRFICALEKKEELKREGEENET